MEIFKKQSKYHFIVIKNVKWNETFSYYDEWSSFETF